MCPVPSFRNAQAQYRLIGFWRHWLTLREWRRPSGLIVVWCLAVSHPAACACRRHRLASFRACVLARPSLRSNHPRLRPCRRREGVHRGCSRRRVAPAPRPAAATAAVASPCVAACTHAQQQPQLLWCALLRAAVASARVSRRQRWRVCVCVGCSRVRD